MFGFAQEVIRRYRESFPVAKPAPVRRVDKRILSLDVKITGVEAAKADIAGLRLELNGLRITLDGLKTDLRNLANRADKPLPVAMSCPWDD